MALPAWLEATAFTRTHRISVWLLCADLLESGFEIERALPVVAEVNRRSGRKSVARIVDGLVPALEAGRLREAVARVTPAAEAMVFEGFGRSEAAEVFRAAARIAEVRDRLAIALRKNLAGPVFLTVIAGGLLYGAGEAFVPALEGLAPIETWPVGAQLAGSLALGFANNVLWIGIGVAVVVAVFAWLGINWVGRGRAVADQVVPFSLVRLVTGLSFVLCVVEAMRAGLDMDRKLFEDLARGGTRYARSRIMAIANAMEGGGGLGRSMERAGHGFPSPELIPVVAALDRSPEWAERLGKFVDRWVRRAERLVEEGALVVNRALTFLIVVIISSGSFLLLGVIQELIGQAF